VSDRKRAHRRSADEVRRYQFRLGLSVLAVAGLLLYWGYLHHLPFAGGPAGSIVRAEVRTAANVNSATPVRVGGIDVGTVERVIPSGGGLTSTLVMRITTPGVVVHADASAEVRFRTLLGGSMYIDLQPGSASAPPLGERTIALARTSAQVDWDEFNSTFAPPVPVSERGIIRGLRLALSDPRAVGELLAVAPPALSSFERSAAAARGVYGGELTDLIRNSARTTAALNGDGHGLGDMVRGAAQIVSAMAGARAQLAGSIATAPAALGSARAALSRLDGTLTRIDVLRRQLLPGVVALAPAVAHLAPATDGANALLSSLRPVLAAAPPALHGLHDAAGSGLGLLGTLAPLVTRLNGTLLPFLTTTDPALGIKVYETIGPFLAVNDDSQSNFDARGYFLRGGGTVNQGSVALPCPVAALQGIANCPLVNQTYLQLLEGKRP